MECWLLLLLVTIQVGGVLTMGYAVVHSSPQAMQIMVGIALTVMLIRFGMIWAEGDL